MTIQIGTDLHAEQLRLEQESTELGARRYAKLRERRGEAGMRPGRKLVLESIDATAEAIRLFVEAASTGKPGKRHTAVPFIRDTAPEVLAYLTAHVCINALALNQPKFTRVAVLLGKDVQNEINFTMLHREHPALHTYIQRKLKKATTRKYTMSVMRHHVDYAAAGHRIAWSDRDALLVGSKLIELFVEATGIVELALLRKGSKETVSVLRAKPEILEWIAQAHENMAMFLPVLQPMVVSPRPWTSPEDGGYLTDIRGRGGLVRTYNLPYKRELEQVDMPLVYRAVNAVQATPWKINVPVLEVMEALWEAGGDVAGLPGRELRPLPAVPALLETDPEYYREHHEEEYRAWTRRRAAVHDENARTVSKRLAAAEKIALARKFATYPAIWFPCNLDFRGRVYPLPPLLNPQGDDAAKALLHFAEGVPLGEDGAFWLAVHVANMFGVDKVAFHARITWVHEHEEQLLDSALDPLDGQRFWMQADLPFCALAACIEWMGYKLNGQAHVSHIPVALDGSCNGLQNFSAMLCDDVGGAATNLVPQPAPTDIYTRVCTLAGEKIRALAEAGDETAIRLDGQLTRDIVKRPVMTLPYGVTKRGMQGQILDALKQRGLDDIELASYLSEVLWECIGEAVHAARATMDWLQAVSKVAAQADLPVYWTTPAGFPVLQAYRKFGGLLVKVHVGGQRKRVVLGHRTDALDRRRQALGISPNFVHACDASHLMLTTCLAEDNGITAFAMIHDSYGTHAGRTSILAAALRQAFVDQYSADVLSDFRQQLAEQLPPELVESIPPLPKKGTLDLNQVLESEYFFA